MTTSTLNIPSTIQNLREKARQPYDIGYACGELLRHISPLVSYHLEQPSTFHNKPPTCTIPTVEFTLAIDARLESLRLADETSEGLPNDRMEDRKERRPHRKYSDRYVSFVENAFKTAVRENLRDMLSSWDAEQTRKFNKGLDRALTGTAWCVYPDENATLVADDWAIWLRGQCEELGMSEAKAGRPVFDEL